MVYYRIHTPKSIAFTHEVLPDLPYITPCQSHHSLAGLPRALLVLLDLADDARDNMLDQARYHSKPPYHTTQETTQPHNTTQRNTTTPPPYHFTPHNTTPHHTTPHNTTPHITTLHHTPTTQQHYTTEYTLTRDTLTS